MQNALHCDKIIEKIKLAIAGNKQMTKKDWLHKNIFTIAIWSIVAVYTVLYISLIFNHNIWTDEAFTLQLLRKSWGDIIKGTAVDVHPPLYYLYAKLFSLCSNNALIVQKIAAIIPMSATLIIGATLIRKEWGDKVSLLFLLFLTCIPCSMEFSVQVRMYSMALLGVTVCGIYAYFAFADGKKKNFLIFAISGVAAAYTHYFALVAAAVITAMLLSAILIWKKERIKAWVISTAFMIVCYLPWFPLFIKQVTRVEQDYWIPEITAETVWDCFVWTFGSENILWLVFIFLIILKTASTYNIINIALSKNKAAIYALLCMLVPTFTTIFGVLASVFGTPIYRDQYIFPALGMLALFFGLVVSRMKKEFVVFSCVFLIFSGGIQYQECFYQEYKSTYVPQTEAFFADNLQEDDYIIYNWEAFGFIYSCYFDDEQLIYLEDFDFSQNFNNIWYIYTERNGLPGIDKTFLDAYGLVAEDMGHYGIEHNEFEIFRIFRYNK